MKESQSYQSMLQEVEMIVRDVASPDLDLDQMVQKVERGYELIRAMKGRLDETKLRMDQLHQKFEDPSASS
jgi:exodeoxyribonuclease VII small subunit